MYLFKEYASKHSLPVREQKPMKFLDVLLIREITKRLTNVNKLMAKGGGAGRKPVAAHIEYIQNLGYTASLIYEVLGGTSVVLSGWDVVVDGVLTEERIRKPIRETYSAENKGTTTGKALIGLYVAMSETKTSEKNRKGHEHELQANKNPVVFNPVRMKHFSLICQEHAQQNTNNSWKAAAVLVEMHTGARITEVLGYADFFAFSELDSDLKTLLLKESRAKVQSYSLQGIEESVVQRGVLKRKNGRKKGGEYEVYVSETLPPKPVIMDLTATDIKKLVFVVRSHVYDVMKKKHPGRFVDDTTRLNSLPPSLFAPFVGQVNAFLDKNLVAGAIVNYTSDGGGAVKNVTSHTLRRFYANYSYEHHAVGMVKNVWIMSVLGHDPKSLSTSLSYTNATMQDPLAFIPVPQKGESLGIQAFNALQDIKFEFQAAIAESRRHGVVPAPAPPRAWAGMKRRRNERDENDDGLVAVLIGPPATIRRVMPERMTETRITNDENAKRRKADVVKDYVDKNFRFQHDGHSYLCKPTSTNVRKCPFGQEYISAFMGLEQTSIQAMCDEYDGIVDAFLI
jgi:hypothetical protein